MPIYINSLLSLITHTSVCCKSTTTLGSIVVFKASVEIAPLHQNGSLCNIYSIFTLNSYVNKHL